MHRIPDSNEPMDTLRALSAFVHSVELGSLSGAARALDTTQPTVSKLVAGLERSLGVRLLRRAATGLSLTEEGQRFHERARRMLEDYGDAVADARAQVQQPRGLLRLSAPVTLGQRHLNAMAVEFLRLYPDIELELVLDDRFVDPREERIDVSLRVVARRVAQVVVRQQVLRRARLAACGHVVRRGDEHARPAAEVARDEVGR